MLQDEHGDLFQTPSTQSQRDSYGQDSDPSMNGNGHAHTNGNGHAKLNGNGYR